MVAMAAAAAGLGAACMPAPPSPAVPERGRVKGSSHLAWAWKFSTDGAPDKIASVLAQNNMGIILKTHTGTDWMSTQDPSYHAVSGPLQVAVLAGYFEKYGVPFHTYCVVQGLDPQKEAEMCAQVIGSGSRSIFVDLEPYDGYYQGTPQSALAFGQEFRRRQPDGNLILCVEPRPWQVSRVPLAEFASFSQGIAPMCYWETFSSDENVRLFQEHGLPPGPDGITPEFLLDVCGSMFGGYGLPIQPIGQGASTNHDAWVHFVSHTYALGMGPVSVWRYGVAADHVWPLLKYCTPPDHSWEGNA